MSVFSWPGCVLILQMPQFISRFFYVVVSGDSVCVRVCVCYVCYVCYVCVCVCVCVFNFFFNIYNVSWNVAVLFPQL